MTRIAEPFQPRSATLQASENLYAFLSPGSDKGPLEVAGDGVAAIGESLLNYAALKLSHEDMRHRHERAQIDLVGAQLGQRLALVFDWSSAQLASFIAALQKAWPQLKAQAEQSFAAWLRGLTALLPAGASSAAIRKAITTAEKAYPEWTKTVAQGSGPFMGQDGAALLGKRLKTLKVAYPKVPTAHLGQLGRMLIAPRAAALTAQWDRLTQTLLAKPDGPGAAETVKKMQATLAAMREINTMLAPFGASPLINQLDDRQAALATWIPKKPTQAARVPASLPTPAGARERNEKERRLNDAEKLAQDVSRPRIGNPGLLSGQTPGDAAQEAVTALKERGRTDAATLAQDKLPKASAGASWPAPPTSRPATPPDEDVLAARAIMQTDAQGRYIVSSDQLNDWIENLALRHPRVAAMPLVADAYALRRLQSADVEDILRTAPAILQPALRMPLYAAPLVTGAARHNASTRYVTQEELDRIPARDRYRIDVRIALPNVIKKNSLMTEAMRKQADASVEEVKNRPFIIWLGQHEAASVVEAVLRKYGDEPSYSFQSVYARTSANTAQTALQDPGGFVSEEVQLSGPFLVEASGMLIEGWVQGKTGNERRLADAIETLLPKDPAQARAVAIRFIMDRDPKGTLRDSVHVLLAPPPPPPRALMRVQALGTVLHEALRKDSKDQLYGLLHHQDSVMNDAARLALVDLLNTGAAQDPTLREMLLTQPTDTRGGQLLQSLRMSDVDWRATLKRYGISAFIGLAAHHPQLREQVIAYLKYLLAHDRVKLHSLLQVAKDLSALRSLAGMSFMAVNLDNMQFNQLDLTGVNFNQTSLMNTDFRGANLTGATFEGSRGRPRVDPGQLSAKQRKQLRLPADGPVPDSQPPQLGGASSTEDPGGVKRK